MPKLRLRPSGAYRRARGGTFGLQHGGAARSHGLKKAMLLRNPATPGQNPCRLRAAITAKQAGTKNRRLLSAEQRT